ncbi:YfhJ family protein [Aquibacillus salsiterrae]|uniref:YfhJ family protein n=1 Tax=Aquibacillus salsiterrae TaxID=2950439 RepID=A0A9X3WFS6_9BACI|nr:YfhJ family protein [Aquibacillus salsiterrae]MDC3418198.1 YfhJ family protein [Aquibacillus salsiterrae]
MEDIFNRLTNKLCEKNDSISVDEARTWVELLWEDFEATRAKAGRKYEGKEVTEQIVSRWLDNYGPKLHEFLIHNDKYKDKFETRNDYLH